MSQLTPAFQNNPADYLFESSLKNFKEKNKNFTTGYFIFSSFYSFKNIDLVNILGTSAVT